ncbi:MAG: cyanophycinase [Cyanobacteria bacterium J06638_6]
MSLVKHNAILAIGGAEDKVHGKEILHTFFERSGGTAACIGIIPCASRDPVAISGRYQQIFADMGATKTVVMDIRDRDQGDDPNWKTIVEPCTGVFITGGDQVRLCGLLADTPLIDLIRQRAQLGEITLAGTSAGAAVMGHHMIAGGGSGESPNRSLVDMAIGLGFVLTCGEIPALALINGVVRLLPGTVGKTDSLRYESFETPLLDYPQYTRPATFRGWDVPEVLLSGNHAAIAQWRKQQQVERTRQRRPDLYQRWVAESEDGEMGR